MTRTFSKMHGLASLRIGWLYGPEAIVDALNRIRGPVQSRHALDPRRRRRARRSRPCRDARSRITRNGWPRVTKAIEGLGLMVTPSVANFVLIHFPTTPGRTAAEAEAFLLAHGVVLRGVAGYGLGHAPRMTIGTAEANEAAIAALAAFLHGAG